MWWDDVDMRPKTQHKTHTHSHLDYFIKKHKNNYIQKLHYVQMPSANKQRAEVEISKQPEDMFVQYPFDYSSCLNLTDKNVMITYQNYGVYCVWAYWYIYMNNNNVFVAAWDRN